MTALNLEGSGVTITFGASSFTSDMISIQLSERARQTIETTHLGTAGAKTFKPGDTTDLGTIDAVFDHRPDEVLLVGNPSEVITIAYPLRDGQVTPDQLQIVGMVTKQGGQRMEMDQRMVTRVQIRLTDRSSLAGADGSGSQVDAPVISPAGGAILTTDSISIATATTGATIYYTTDGSTPTTASTLYTAPFTLAAGTVAVKAFAVKSGYLDSAVASAVYEVLSPLADPSQWLGAWDFASSGASIITGKPALDSILSGYPTQFATVTGGQAVSYPSAESALVTATGFTVTTVSIAAFITQPSSIHLEFFGLHTASAGAVLRIISDGRVQGSTIVNGVFTPNYSSTYHIAATYDGTNVRVYLDGVLTYTGPLAIGSGTGFAGVYFGYNVGAPLRYMDNFVVTTEVLSPAAIAALAAGRMPNAAGILT